MHKFYCLCVHSCNTVASYQWSCLHSLSDIECFDADLKHFRIIRHLLIVKLLAFVNHCFFFLVRLLSGFCCGHNHRGWIGCESHKTVWVSPGGKYNHKLVVTSHAAFMVSLMAHCLDFQSLFQSDSSSSIEFGHSVLLPSLHLRNLSLVVKSLQFGTTFYSQYHLHLLSVCLCHTQYTCRRELVIPNGTWIPSFKLFELGLNWWNVFSNTF